jgi:hypothetical protein
MSKDGKFSKAEYESLCQPDSDPEEFWRRVISWEERRFHPNKKILKARSKE